MALTYEESAALMKDETFRGRVKVSCLHFASYILGEAPTIPAHNTRLKWAQATYQNPDFTAGQTVPNVVVEDLVQTAGAEITDPDLQTATENAVNKSL